jgi:alpha-galactosidase
MRSPQRFPSNTKRLRCPSVKMVTARSRIFQKVVWNLGLSLAAYLLTSCSSAPIHPPQGWSSWYAFYDAVNDTKVRQQADLLVSTGLRDAGYVYVNVDAGWQGYRDSDGIIHPNANFPDMKALGQFLHSRGLRFGIYSSPGPVTCDNLPGSGGFEQQDANTYADWGVDFLKYDRCSPVQSQPAYKQMRNALDETGRHIDLSISEGGEDHPWEWGPSVGALMWRTNRDLGWIQGWAGLSAFQRIQAVAAHVEGLQSFASHGHYNDPDYLLIGIKKYCLGPYAPMTDCPAWSVDPMTLSQEEAQLQLWRGLNCPLIISVPIENLTSGEIELLKGYAYRR